MPFTTNMTGTAALDHSIIELYDQQFVIASAEMGVMEQLVTHRRDIGAKSISMPKYAQLALATTALTQDEDVTSEAMVDSEIIFTPAEYGKVVTTTKLANLQTGGKADLAAARLVGMNMGRTNDKLAVLACEASANVLTSTGGAVADLVAANVMTPAFLGKLYNKIARSNIMPLMEGHYVAVMHDDVIHDIRESAGWQDVAKYSDAMEVLKNEVGIFKGFRILRDNLTTIQVDAGDGAVDVYNTICLGFNALGKATSQESSIVFTGPFDKLNRFVNIGWHGVHHYGIVDTAAVFVGKSSSSVGVNV